MTGACVTFTQDRRTVKWIWNRFDDLSGNGRQSRAERAVAGRLFHRHTKIVSFFVSLISQIPNSRKVCRVSQRCSFNKKKNKEKKKERGSINARKRGKSIIHEVQCRYFMLKADFTNYRLTSSSRWSLQFKLPRFPSSFMDANLQIMLRS